ncbi:MAG TPA: cytochrome c [Gammaproteobacteria bacterium]
MPDPQRRGWQPSRGVAAAALAGLMAAVPPARGQEAGPAPPAACPAEAPCPVPVPVYIGSRVYNAHCASCHAEDAVGSSFAPDLTRRIAQMDEREFVDALDRGHLGPRDPTPPRGANPDVARYYAELWAYLEARASGRLPPGAVTPVRPR